MSQTQRPHATDRRTFLRHLAGLGGAALAGMRHFYVEQDPAPLSGDSIAAAATSYRNLVRILS